MKRKDKILLKKSAENTLDAVISLVPGLNIAWGLAKACYGAGIELRKDRALEFVESIRKNPQIFSEKLLRNQEFVDGFVYIRKIFKTAQ